MQSTDDAAPTATPAIDKDALRRRYAAERDKRLRPDGNDQYLRLQGQLAHYLDDPYVPRSEREPLDDHVTVALIGGGFAGLVTAARLVEAGVDDIRIIEKGGDFGGTWYWNRYPGARCDIESYIYLPLLEEVGYLPVEIASESEFRIEAFGKPYEARRGPRVLYNPNMERLKS